jgi:membrane protease YdiL (CAAX protease family)
VGLIWGAWHLPYFSFVTSYTTESLAMLIPRFLAGTIAASIVYGEIRILTDSLWPAVLMQTVGGAFASALVMQDLFEVAGGMDFVFAPVVEGGLIIVLFALIGVGIHRLRTRQTTAAQA